MLRPLPRISRGRGIITVSKHNLGKWDVIPHKRAWASNRRREREREGGPGLKHSFKTSRLWWIVYEIEIVYWNFFCLKTVKGARKAHFFPRWDPWQKTILSAQTFAFGYWHQLEKPSIYKHVIEVDKTFFFSECYSLFFPFSVLCRKKLLHIGCRWSEGTLKSFRGPCACQTLRCIYVYESSSRGKIFDLLLWSCGFIYFVRKLDQKHYKSLWDALPLCDAHQHPTTIVNCKERFQSWWQQPGNSESLKAIYVWILTKTCHPIIVLIIF